MRQPARPDLWEARVRQPPGPTRQASSSSGLRSPSPVWDRPREGVGAGVMKQAINPPSLFRSLDHGFSQAVMARGGKTLYVSGQTAWDSQKRLVGGGDLEGQARQAFTNVRAVVEAAGGTLADVVFLRIYVVDYRPEKAAAVGSAFRHFFSGEAKPAATWVGVAALADPGFLIEVEATAVLD